MAYKGGDHIYQSHLQTLKFSYINKCSEPKIDQILDRQKTFTKEIYVWYEDDYEHITDIEYPTIPTKKHQCCLIHLRA